MYDPTFVPKTYVPVPGDALGSTFKSVQFCTVDRSTFWVSNRYLRYSEGRYYMPATMVARINKGYRGTGTVKVKYIRTLRND